jgi:hypothetical protein
MVAKAFVIATALGLIASPASAMVINISGTQNGEQSEGGPEETGALISPVQVTFQPGTYLISDAYNPSQGYESGAIYDAWNFEAGNPQAWAWHWKALLDDGADGATINSSNYSAHLLLDVDSLNPQDTFTSESAAAAFGAATTPSTLTFTATTTVDFIVDDYYLPDNAGGVSLDIQSLSTAPAAVPETASWAMMLCGFGLVGTGLRRRKVAISFGYPVDVRPSRVRGKLRNATAKSCRSA